MRRKRFVILDSAALLVVIVVLVYVFVLSPRFFREEYIGGKYHCRLGITGEDPQGFEWGWLFYVKDEVEQKGYFNAYLRNALDWIKVDTPESAVFLNWWDYGHMIVGYSERESVIKNPSEEALVSVGDPADYEELVPHEMIVDVAKALTTTNESETLSMMNKYNATHILVAAVDGGRKATWIFRFAGHNITDYMNMTWYSSSHNGYTFNPNMYNEIGKKTTIYKILTNAEIKGLIQVYSDEYVKIYKLEP